MLRAAPDVRVLYAVVCTCPDNEMQILLPDAADQENVSSRAARPP